MQDDKWSVVKTSVYLSEVQRNSINFPKYMGSCTTKYSPEFAHAHIYLDSPRETGLKVNQQYVIETSFHLMILNE